MPEKSKEQHLVDLCFEIAITMQMNQKWLKKQSRDDIGKWVADQLKNCGFPTTPCGSSWGVLTEPNLE